MSDAMNPIQAAEDVPSEEAVLAFFSGAPVQGIRAIRRIYALARTLDAELARLRERSAASNDDICQTLGKALGYPWFKDDQKNFPGATEENGVCVGDHIAESIASEAAAELARKSTVVEAQWEIVESYKKENAELEALLASLTSVSEEDVERAREAIDRQAICQGIVLNEWQVRSLARAALTAFVRG